MRKNIEWSGKVESQVVDPNSLQHAINACVNGLNQNIIQGNGGKGIKFDIYRLRYDIKRDYQSLSDILGNV